MGFPALYFLKPSLTQHLFLEHKQRLDGGKSVLHDGHHFLGEGNQGLEQGVELDMGVSE